MKLSEWEALEGKVVHMKIEEVRPLHYGSSWIDVKLNMIETGEIHKLEVLVSKED